MIGARHTVETLQELLDRENGFIRGEIDAERKLVAQRFRSISKATVLETRELARRLGELNHAHELARQKEVDFIGREAFNTHVSRTADDFERLRKEIQAAASALNLVKEQAATALANALSEQSKLGEARFSRLEKSQSMMLGGLILVGVCIPLITAAAVHFMAP
jgi:hypothetical protein